MTEHILKVRYRFKKKELPFGIYRGLMSILSERIGYINAISRDDLLRALESYGIHVDERQLRDAIRDLRVHDRILVCSNSGDGYWIAADRAEGDLFISDTRKRLIEPTEEMLRVFEAELTNTYGPNPGAEQPGLF